MPSGNKVIGKPDLIGLNGDIYASNNLAPQEYAEDDLGTKFDRPYPHVVGGNVMLREDEVSGESKTKSGLLKGVGDRKKLFTLVELGPELIGQPYSAGDYVEAFTKDYTYFTGFDGLKYVICPNSNICGYYKRKD